MNLFIEFSSEIVSSLPFTIRLSPTEKMQQVRAKIQAKEGMLNGDACVRVRRARMCMCGFSHKYALQNPACTQFT